MDTVETMRAFVTVAEMGSFTRAADKLNTSNQLVSKYVSHLEERLNTRLFNRTTRSVSITDEGEVCLEHARQILGNIEDMEGHFSEMHTEIKGLLSISAPVSFSTLHLSKLLCDFKQHYPMVGIDLQLNDRKVDVVEEGYDVVLRIGHLKSSSLIAKKIAPINLVICAAPAYLKKHGIPEKPSELNRAHYLRYSYMEYNQSNEALASALKGTKHEQESTLTANNGEILMDAAIAGEGFVIQPTFIVSNALKEGKLQRILVGHEPQPMGLYMVYPHRKLMSSKLSAFIDFSSSYYGEKPYWDSSL